VFSEQKVTAAIAAGGGRIAGKETSLRADLFRAHISEQRT